MNKSNEKKRVRAPNFSADEKVMLMDIIKKYKAIVNNKKTDAAALQIKNNAWTCITNEYNTGSTIRRTTESLKVFYDNQKRMTQKRDATQEKKTNLTEGVCSKVHNDEMFNLTMEIVNKKTVYGLSNTFDGDMSPRLETTHILPSPKENEEVPEAPKNTTVDWDNHKATNLKIPLSSKLGLLISNQQVVPSGSGSSEEHVQPSSSKKENQKINDKEGNRRRRPAMSATASVSRKYEDVADAKLELANVQLSILKRAETFQKRIMEESEEKFQLEKTREEQLFSYKLRKEELDIAIKEAQLELLRKQSRDGS